MKHLQDFPYYSQVFEFSLEDQCIIYLGNEERFARCHNFKFSKQIN